MSAFEFDNDYDPDEKLMDENDGLFFVDDDDDLDAALVIDLDDDEDYDGYDPEEEIEAMFPNDDYGEELEDYILDEEY
jgi:hypothetical protein